MPNWRRMETIEIFFYFFPKNKKSVYNINTKNEGKKYFVKNINKTIEI